MTYLAASVSYRTHDFASITAEASRTPPNPVLWRAEWFLGKRGAVSITHAAVAAISRQGVIESTYPFMVGMQVNLLFAALFAFINVFSATHRLSFLLAAALTIGFFQQYVFDINAWSELSSQPLFLLIVTFTALAFDRTTFKSGNVRGVAGLGSILGVLGGAVLYLYPEALTIYGPACAAVLIVALAMHESRKVAPLALASLGVAAGLALLLCLLFWQGTVDYVYRILISAAEVSPDWWRYFAGYLFGSDANYVDILANGDRSAGQVAAALFSLPVEAMAAGLGLYFMLPTPSWPALLAAIWKIVLYGFLVILIKGIAGALVQFWRTSIPGNAARVTIASITACLMPLLVLWSGHPWAAGKGLSMASPLLFLLAVAPLLAPTGIQIGRFASLALVAAHLALGLLRPVYVTPFAGAGLPGLPTAAPQMNDQKAELDWDYRRWMREMQQCRGIFIDVDSPFMQQLMRRAAIELRIPWAAKKFGMWPERLKAPWLPRGWEEFDCLVSDGSIRAKPGQRLILLSKDQSVFQYIEGRRAAIEFGTKPVPGVASSGVFGRERTPEGDLQWASQNARFEVPNNPGAPAKSLLLQLWPMPLVGARLDITINGDVVYRGPVPANAVTIQLDNYAAATVLAIEIGTDAATRYPGDPRTLGFAIRQLSINR
jgi:hypothetical protein